MFPVATFHNTKSIGVGCCGCNTWGAMNKCQNCHFPENLHKILCHFAANKGPFWRGSWDFLHVFKYWVLVFERDLPFP